MRRSLRRRGFTMVELLVAVLLSSIVMITVYFVFQANTRQFYTQEQVVQMQEAMRFALEYLKTDLRNAGRHSLVSGAAVPDGGDPGYCRAADARRGVQLFENDANQPTVLTANNNGLRPDRLRLLADASGDVRLTARQVLGDRVTISPASGQRTTDAAAVVGAEARFNRTYRIGYLLRIENVPKGRFDLVPIAAAAFNGGMPQIQLSLPVCGDVALCAAGECLVNPVQVVEYVVRPDPPLDRDSPKTDLVRRVVDARNMAGELTDVTVTVAEHVVDFQVWGQYDTRPAGGPLPQMAADTNPADTRGNWPAADPEGAIMAANPHRLRALNLLLAVRTPREDPEYRLAIDLAVAPADRLPADRTWFDLTNLGDPAYARVATLGTEVETPNMKKVF